MRIVFVASECVPFVKTGGLADVIGILPLKIAALGHEVKVILPYYRSVKAYKPKPKKLPISLSIPMADAQETAEIYHLKSDTGVEFIFVSRDEYYDREGLYVDENGDYPDNAPRFIFFSKAALKYLNETQYHPDIINCHDWHTGLVPVLLHEWRKEDSFYDGIKSLFTIHNIAYQGLSSHLNMPLANLDWSYFTPKGLEFYGMLNLLKAGIVFADAVSTVSPRYSQEIQTPEYGCGLEGVLSERRHVLHGILNGADYDLWDPEKDRFIVQNYSQDDLSGKRACKRDLMREFGLRLPEETPLIAVISRLADQKGFDLIGRALYRLMPLGVGVVVLGDGEERYENMLRRHALRHPERLGVRIGFDEALAHKMEAGADIFLMPSRYEPCGLNQIYSLKYGTIPVVRATGGLDDTVSDYNPETARGNGFKFSKYEVSALIEALERALSLHRNKRAWENLVRHCMTYEFSWETQALKYVELYHQMMED
ncbi:Glycogen synthase [subsurface metagenome]